MRADDLPISGDALRARLREVGMNMSELADALGIRPQAVHKWVSGRSRPSAKYMPKMLELLQLEVETRSDNERLEAVEHELSQLRDQVADVARLLEQLVRQQTDAAGVGSASPVEQARPRSRP